MRSLRIGCLPVLEDQHLVGGDEIQIGKFRFVFLLGLDSGS